MNSVVFDMPVISDLALKIMLRVIKANETAQTIADDESGPIALASALSDFFELATGLEHANQTLEPEAASELAHHALDLADRLSYQLRQLDIHDQQEALASLFASLSIWFARRSAVLENLDGTADGFARLVNRENGSEGLTTLRNLMNEVLLAASAEIKADEDRSNPWRPWRMLNLNMGIAATRSLDPQLMVDTFEALGPRLPHDLPGFFSDGRRQMDAQDVPQEVRDVLTRYAEKWPMLSPRIPLDA